MPCLLCILLIMNYFWLNLCILLHTVLGVPTDAIMVNLHILSCCTVCISYIYFVNRLDPLQMRYTHIFMVSFNGEILILIDLILLILRGTPNPLTLKILLVHHFA